MTRKDYIMIARLIHNRTLLDNKNRLNKQDLVQDLCVELKLDNELFNTYKFIKACE